MPASARHHRGFSFVEILFAIIILGVGFIMVAAIFPVALQQAKITGEETSAAAVARGAVSYISQYASDTADTTGMGTLQSNVPGTSELAGASNTDLVRRPNVAQPSFVYAPPVDPAPNRHLWTPVAGNAILPEDPRAAYVMLYRRGGIATDETTWNASAQIYLISVQCRAKTLFTTDDLKIPAATPDVPNLMAHQVRFCVLPKVASAGGADLIIFDTNVRSATDIYALNVTAPGGGAVCEGAYVVIDNDRIATPGTYPTSDDRRLMNGTILKVGARRSDLDNSTSLSSLGITATNSANVYELDVTSPFLPSPGADGIFGSSDITKIADDILALGVNSYGGSGVTFTAGAPAFGMSTGFVVGRGYTDPLNPSSGYEGGCMATGIYTTFVKVN